MVNVNVKTRELPKSLWKKVLVALIVLALIAGAIYYYAWPKSDDNDTPPVLGFLSEEQLQGMMVTQGNWLKFEETTAETTAHVCPAGTSYIPAPVGVNYFYTKEEVSYQDVINAIKPVAGSEIVIVYYNVLGNEPYGAPNANVDKNFFVYPNPVGVNVVTTVLADKLSTYKIPPYMGFAIIVNKKSTSLCSNKFGGSKEKFTWEAKVVGKTFAMVNEDLEAEFNEFWDKWVEGLPFGSESFEPCSGTGNSSDCGWVLLPFNDFFALTVLLDLDMSSSSSDVVVWGQTGDNKFEKIDVEEFIKSVFAIANDDSSLTIPELSPYKMLWIRGVKYPPAETTDPGSLSITSASVKDGSDRAVVLGFSKNVSLIDKSKVSITVWNTTTSSVFSGNSYAVQKISYTKDTTGSDVLNSLEIVADKDFFDLSGANMIYRITFDGLTGVDGSTLPAGGNFIEFKGEKQTATVSYLTAEEAFVLKDYSGLVIKFSQELDPAVINKSLYDLYISSDDSGAFSDGAYSHEVGRFEYKTVREFGFSSQDNFNPKLSYALNDSQIKVLYIVFDKPLMPLDTGYNYWLDLSALKGVNGSELEKGLVKIGSPSGDADPLIGDLEFLGAGFLDGQPRRFIVGFDDLINPSMVLNENAFTLSRVGSDGIKTSCTVDTVAIYQMPELEDMLGKLLIVVIENTCDLTDGATYTLKIDKETGPKNFLGKGLTANVESDLTTP